MRAAYRLLAFLVPIMVALQASFIALGLFGIDHYVEKGDAYTKTLSEGKGGAFSGGIGLELHGIGAMVSALVAILLLVVSFFAKVDSGVRWASLIFLDTLIQFVLAFLSFSVWAVGLFHGLNAFVLAGLGVMAIRAASVPAPAAVEKPAAAG